MSQRIRSAKLEVDPLLAEFVNTQLLPQLTMSESDFWAGFEAIIEQFTPRNATLLAVRDEMQARIDTWHLQNREKPFDASVYKEFLRDIGYLVDEGADFSVATEHVDPEIATVAGPQLVVPVKNARFALNAANAR